MKVLIPVLLMASIVLAASSPSLDLATQVKAQKALSKAAPATAVQQIEPSSEGKFEAVLRAVEADGFGKSTVILPHELSPLEQQIAELERQARGDVMSQPVDEVTFANLKEQLNELYAQRPENRERNPLDQGNDNCPATLITSIPFSDNGSTVGLTNDFSPISPCNSTNAPDVVYVFTPTTSDFYNISLMGSSYDTYLYVHTLGACPGIFSVGCNDDNSPSLQSYLSLYLTAGQVYYIIVDGYNSSAGSYVLNITGNCSIECEPNDVFECPFEEVLGDPVFDCNYFCNTYFDIQNINFFQTICGRTWATNGQHDLDWYYFQIFEPCSLDITLRTEVPLRLQLNSYPSFDCNYTTYFDQFLAFPCSTVTYRVPCVQPGEYTLLLATDALNIAPDFREYRVRVDPVPCSGCRIDAFLQAPGSVVGNTCSTGNDNSLRPSPDNTYYVNIPHESDWTFSMCNDDSLWDSYLYLTTYCNSGSVAEDDDGCGTRLSKMNCVHLFPGTYYLTVEGYSGGDCGPFSLNVSECTGTCCLIIDQYSIACSQTTLTGCNDIGGMFGQGLSCETDICPSFQPCDDRSVYSQQPMVPQQNPGAFRSHLDYGDIQFDNYVTPQPIGALRFWGLPLECNGAPETFRVYITDGGSTCEYNITTTGTQLPDLYYGSLHLSQYDVTLNPPCGIPTGSISIAKVGDAGCMWYWVESQFGDDYSSQSPTDFAFCLTPPCPAPDSVTIKMLISPPDAYTIRWRQQEAGSVTLWWSTNPSAVFPATYTADWSLYVPAGTYNNTSFSPSSSNEVIFVLTLDCGAAPPAAGVIKDPEFIKQEDIK